MGVEIIILSGSRQGEQLALSADEFRVGGDSSCDVFFDPHLDATASQRVALLQKTDEGWYIRNLGRGELLLNQAVVSGRTRIRSGDIVRLSDRGPDFGFEITAGRPRPLCAAQRPEAAAVAGSEGLPHNGDAESTLAPRPPHHKWHGWSLPFVASAAAGVVLLAALAILVLFRPVASDARHDTVALTQPDADAPKVVSLSAEKAVPTASGGADDDELAAKTAAEKTAEDVSGLAAAAKRPDRAAEQNSPVHDSVAPNRATETTAGIRHAAATEPFIRDCAKTIWLVELCDAEGKFAYPFATAVAVGERALLTTASVARELENFSSRGWKITAANAELQKSVDIENIRLHGVYADLAGNPQQQIYVDLAVLRSGQDLGKTIAVPASAAELARLDTGAELACVGISHLGDAMRPPDALRSETLRPQAFYSKVFLRTKLDPRSASSPRLLHFKAQLGENMYGSPIINKNGHVVAVYAETAAGGEAKRLGLHYAPVLDPALIRTAVEGKAEPYWVQSSAAGKENRNKNNSK